MVLLLAPRCSLWGSALGLLLLLPLSSSKLVMKGIPSSKKTVREGNAASQWHAFPSVNDFIQQSTARGGWEPDLVPEAVDVYYDESLLGGGDKMLANQMLDSGRVEISLANGIYSSNAICTSMMAVTDMKGRLVSSVLVTDFEGVSAYDDFEDSSVLPPPQYHGEAVSRIEAAKIIEPGAGIYTVRQTGGDDDDDASEADSYFYKYGSGAKDGSFLGTELPTTIWGSSHDIAWLPKKQTYLISTGNSDDTVEVETVTEYTGKGVMRAKYESILEYDVDGKLVWRWDFSDHVRFDYDKVVNKAEVGDWRGSKQWVHVNHINSFDNDVYVSARNLHGLFKISRETEEVVWVLGGPYGTLDITLLDGMEMPKGTNVFFSQHNAEYIGDNTVVLFNNGAYAGGTRATVSSSFMYFTIDEESQTATQLVDWNTGSETNIFGDADPVPAGNTLVPTWQASTIYPCAKDGSQYEAGVMEVTPNGEVAWSMMFKAAWRPWRTDDKCDSYPGSAHATPCGWALYNAERFYTAPLLHHVSVTVIETQTDDGDARLAASPENQPVCILSAEVFNSVRTQTPREGSFRLVPSTSSSPPPSSRPDPPKADKAKSKDRAADKSRVVLAEATVIFAPSSRPSQASLVLPNAVCSTLVQSTRTKTLGSSDAKAKQNKPGFSLPSVGLELEDSWGNVRTVVAEGELDMLRKGGRGAPTEAGPHSRKKDVLLHAMGASPRTNGSQRTGGGVSAVAGLVAGLLVAGVVAGGLVARRVRQKARRRQLYDIVGP